LGSSLAQASTSGIPEAIKGLPEAQQQNILGLAQRAKADVNNSDALNVLIRASETQTQVGQDLTGQEVWDRTHDYLKLSGANGDQIAQIKDNFVQNGVVKFDKSYWSNPAPDANTATARTDTFLGFRSVDSTIIGTGKVLTEFGEFVESNPIAKYSLMALDVASGPALYAVRNTPGISDLLESATQFAGGKFAQGFAATGRNEVEAQAGGIGGVAALSVAGGGFLGAVKGLKSFVSDFKESRLLVKELEQRRVDLNFERDGGVDPHIVDPRISAQQRLVEMQKRFTSMMHNGDAHFIEKHGPQTTLKDQYARAKTGGWPDASGTKPMDASRFFNPEDMETALKQAIANRKPGSFSVEVDMGKPIGEGFMKGSVKNSVSPEYRQSNIVLVNFDKSTGLPYTAFPWLKNGVTMPTPRF